MNRSYTAHMLAAAILLPGSLGAAADGLDSDIEEVTVTATRREAAVMDIPQSIQAISAEVLERPTFDDVSDVFNLIPSATIMTNKSPDNEGIQLRASGATQSGISDGLPPVGYYVDDIPYVDLTTAVPPPIGTFDLERIEVIRGPQGTSYGQDSTAGSVILRTNPVDLEEFGYQVRMGISERSGGDGNGETYGGIVNAPIASGTAGLRLAFMREEDPGYGRFSNGMSGNPMAHERDSMRAKFRWKPTDETDINLTHSRWKTTYTVLPGSQIEDTLSGELVVTPYQTDLLLDLFPAGYTTNVYDIRWTTLSMKHELDFASLQLSSGYVDTPRKDNFSENTIYGFPLGFLAYQPGKSKTHELRLVSTTESNVQWILGAFYLDATSNGNGYISSDLRPFYGNDPSFIYNSYYLEQNDSEVKAVFGEVDYKINEQWSFQVGVRLQDQEIATTAVEGYPLPGDPASGPYSYILPPSVQEFDFDNTSYRVGVTWRPTENSMIYLSQSTAARAPILISPADEEALISAGVTPLSSSKASELENTEIGAKWTSMDGGLEIELVYAHGIWDEVPLYASVIVPGRDPLMMGIGGTEGYVGSYEWSLRYNLSDNLSIAYVGAYVDTEVEDIPDDRVTDFPPAIREGGELFNYSPDTHSFSIDYNSELGNGWETFMSMNYTARSKPNGYGSVTLGQGGSGRLNAEYTPARDSYEFMTFSFGVEKGPWNVTLSVDNVTDYDGMYEPLSAGWTNGSIMPPRTTSIQVTYDQF